MVCQFPLYNKVNQLYIYIYPHISSLLSLPPSYPPYPTPLGGHKHRADFPVLCGCFPLAIGFIFGSVYMSMPLSYFVPVYLSPSLCPQVHSIVRVRLYSCPAPRFFMTTFFFLDSKYMCQHMVFVFLFLTYFTLYERLWSTHLTTNNLISFPFMAEYYSIVYMRHIFFIHSSVDGHLGCLHIMASKQSCNEYCGT